MRLLNTATFRLEEFTNEEDIRYGILSHRWKEEEVTFQDMQSAVAPRHKKGFEKIQMCCQKAFSENLAYIWVDTCCIDKSSSAELGEAINSMYRWYRRAVICFVYLFDLKAVKPCSITDSFGKSEWFTRGWTLQELIAPTRVVFYGRDWHALGDKLSLGRDISAVTGISLAVLEGKSNVQELSIAERMSWASKRITTRIEDISYSLLGIFDVNMPMLYGEGEKAFLRLQEEIIKHSDDHSVFAWQGMEDGNPGLLARSPIAFVSCRNIKKKAGARKGRDPYSITNRGLSITLNLTPWTTDTYLALINCCRKPSSDQDGNNRFAPMGILLRRLTEDDQYARVKVAGEELIDDAISHSNSTRSRDPSGNFARELQGRDVAIKVRQAILFRTEDDYLAERLYGFRISNELLKCDSHGSELFKVEGGRWNATERLLTVARGCDTADKLGYLDISKQRRKIKIVKLGFDFEFNPVCFLAESAAIDQKVKLLDKDGNLNWKIDWGDEEKHGWKSIWERSANDELSWNMIRQKTALRNQFRDGLWALKGDRVDGLDVELSDPNLGSGCRVRMKKGILWGRMVWEFDIDNLRGNFWRREKGKPAENGQKGGFTRFLSG